MTISKFLISGMTCQACVTKITSILKSIPQVNSVNVNLNDNSATIESDFSVSLETVKKSLAEFSKYSVASYTPQAKLAIEKLTTESSKWTTYKPLIAVFTFVLLVSLAFQVFHGSFHLHLFMNHIMAGFFIGLSFFKFLNLKAFAESFSSYDPIAQRFLPYGFIYPFIELALGLLFIAGKGLLVANVITLLVLSITTVGVIIRLQSKGNFQCACLGAAFSLPLSAVTVFENIVMILMAVFSIINLMV